MDGLTDLTQDLSIAAETKAVNLGKNLKKLLLENKLNILKLSKLTDVPKSTLSDWIAGNSPKNIAQVKAVADYFKVSIDHLVFGDGSMPVASICKGNTEVEFLNFGRFDVYLKKIEK